MQGQGRTALVNGGCAALSEQLLQPDRQNGRILRIVDRRPAAAGQIQMGGRQPVEVPALRVVEQIQQDRAQIQPV